MPPVFPDETELLSLFECEPRLYDTSSKDLPFYYNQATYQFSNGEEDFLIVLSPSYGEVKNTSDSPSIQSVNLFSGFKTSSKTRDYS